MKKQGLTALICCLMMAGVQAQTVLKGKISNMSPAAVPVALIDFWNLDHWQQLAPVQLENGVFSVSVSQPEPTQCRIRMTNQSGVWSEFVLPGAASGVDTVLVFDLDNKTMNGGPARLPGSAENELYFQLMTEYKKLNQLRDSLGNKTSDKLTEMEIAFNKLCLDMAKQHPGTFTGDVVASVLYQPRKEDYAKDPKVATMTANEFAKAHALDKAAFRYAGVLRHSGFYIDLQRYFNYFDLKTPGAAKEFIEGVMSKRNGNEDVDLFLFRYLLDKMVDYKDEEGLQHLLTWHLPDCSSDSPLPNFTKTLVQALQHCEPGKVIEDQKFLGVNGDSVSLADVCAKNKITLLYFWRSGCSHCKEFKPVIQEIYGKYHPQGVEVLAISLDHNEATWKDSMQKEPTNLLNVYAPNAKRKEINQQFPVPSTPALISLDSHRKVLSRLILRSQLEVYLKDALAKLGG